MKDLDELRRVRAEAANAANSEDAAIWRWFSSLMEDCRIRWSIAAGNRWLVSVDNRHIATERSFDSAVRTAKDKVNERDACLHEQTGRKRRIV